MKRKKTIILIVVLALTISAFVSIAINIDSFLDVAERFLVIADHPEKCDIIFVPSGNPKYRFPKAVTLLKAGLADKIIINLEKLSGDKLAFQRRYGDRFSRQAMIEYIAQVEGVDKRKVMIPLERSCSTREDFELLKGIINREQIKSIIVISSWYHLKRCQLVAKKVLGNDVKAYFVPGIPPNKNLYISRHKRIIGLFNIYLRLAYYYAAS